MINLYVFVSVFTVVTQSGVTACAKQGLLVFNAMNRAKEWHSDRVATRHVRVLTEPRAILSRENATAPMALLGPSKCENGQAADRRISWQVCLYVHA